MELDPEGIRILARRLCGEAQFKADPLNSVLKAVRWLDDCIGNEEGQQLAGHQDAEIRRLNEIIKARGLPGVAEALGVGQSTVRSWLFGTDPSRENRKRIEQYLQACETAPTSAAEPAGTGELFTPEPAALDEQQLPPGAALQS
jgi:hypothetical protein